MVPRDTPIAQASPRPITKRSSKGRIKSSTVAIYTSVFVLLVAVIAVGYRAPQEATTTASAAPVANTQQASSQPAVNDVVATDIAAVVASAAGLAVAPDVAELAVSTRIQSEYTSSTDNSSISKPVIVQLSAASRNISTYEVVKGDTIASLVKKFGISELTIRWANDMKQSDTLAVGSTIDILPVTGIVYTVRDGDTIQKIVERYGSTASAITTYNDLELNGISTGLKIIIPDGQLPTAERPGYVAPVRYLTGYSSGFSGGRTWFISGGIGISGGYGYGQCTSYAHYRRAQLGAPIGVRWGNASSWAYNADKAGYKVDRTPSVGAVIQNAGGFMNYGHVAIVEEILPNGDLRLSEMNAMVAGGGYNIVSGRILPAAVVGQYAYIH